MRILLVSYCYPQTANDSPSHTVLTRQGGIRIDMPGCRLLFPPRTHIHCWQELIESQEILVNIIKNSLDKLTDQNQLELPV